MVNNNNNKLTLDQQFEVEKFTRSLPELSTDRLHALAIFLYNQLLTYENENKLLLAKILDLHNPGAGDIFEKDMLRRLDR